VLVNALETLGNVKEIIFLVPKFSDEDYLNILSVIETLQRGFEVFLAFSPGPVQWRFNEAPTAPGILILRCKLDSEGLDEVKEPLVSNKLAADGSDWM